MGKNYPKCRINALLRRKFLKYFNMKKLTFLCVAVMVTAALIFKAENSFSQVYQLENPGFEEWDDNGEPTGWNSFPSANCTLGSALCETAAQTRHEQSDDVRPGSTGSSIKIFSTSVNVVLTTITANGALTSGQMQITNALASNVNNCNQTKTSNEEFNHRLNAKPLHTRQLRPKRPSGSKRKRIPKPHSRCSPGIQLPKQWKYMATSFYTDNIRGILK